MVHPTSIRLRDTVAAEVEARGESRNQIINRDLDRLYALYKRALREVDLNTKEAMLIVDSLNGTVFTDPLSATLLWANIEDSIRLDDLDAKWDVDGAALATKLRGLTSIQAMAVVDAAERFWADPEKDIEPWVRECFGIR
ncbi:MAG: hypothetical protein RDU41_05975 [Clostridia bacterium]|nr:hypothetical protein [Clostridia bacterium]